MRYIRPVWWISSPSSSFSTLDLPHPLRPVRATRSPRRTSKRISPPNLPAAVKQRDLFQGAERFRRAAAAPVISVPRRFQCCAAVQPFLRQPPAAAVRSPWSASSFWRPCGRYNRGPAAARNCGCRFWIFLPVPTSPPCAVRPRIAAGYRPAAVRCVRFLPVLPLLVFVPGGKIPLTQVDSGAVDRQNVVDCSRRGRRSWETRIKPLLLRR